MEELWKSSSGVTCNVGGRARGRGCEHRRVIDEGNKKLGWDDAAMPLRVVTLLSFENLRIWETIRTSFARRGSLMQVVCIIFKRWRHDEPNGYPTSSGQIKGLSNRSVGRCSANGNAVEAVR
jgi:hypothetical protein